MKSSVVVKTMLICQGFRFSSDLDNGNIFVPSDLCIAILFKKIVKELRLEALINFCWWVNATTFENNPMNSVQSF